MDSLYFTCDLFDVEVRSYSAALITSQQELFEINSYLRILNDDDNFLHPINKRVKTLSEACLDRFLPGKPDPCFSKGDAQKFKIPIEKCKII